MAAKGTQLQAQGLRGTELQAKTRLLLALWDLGGAEAAVKKGEVTERLKRTGETAKDYQPIFAALDTLGAIAITKRNQISLEATGMELLGQCLANPEFSFESQIGAKTANALLKWLREQGTTTAIKPKTIGSYEEFKTIALETYDRLNKDYNFDHLVPIYRIRREIGDRVSRSQFSDWMLEMQANDIFQLTGGEMADITPDKREDSITLPSGGFRYYIQHLDSDN